MKTLKQQAIQCGHYAVAKYLKNRGYSLDETLALLGLIRKPGIPALLRYQAH